MTSWFKRSSSEEAKPAPKLQAAHESTPLQSGVNSSLNLQESAPRALVAPLQDHAPATTSIVPNEAPREPLEVAAKIINNIADFPNREDVLSGPAAATPGLTVPANLQDYVIVVRVSAGRAILVYDPTQTAKVKAYFSALRNAVIGQGLRMDADPYLATTEVIRSVRLAAEAKRLQTSVTSSTSGGASLFREWVIVANEARATDVHLSILAGGRGQVTMRVDGELEPINAANSGIFTDADVRNAIKSAFENMADLHSNNDGTFSDSKTMSCMIDSRLAIPHVRLRFASQRGFFGPKAVCRILHSELNDTPMPFETMGLAPSQIALLQRAQRLEAGAIIQTGVTGSGKTTAAKTFIETHPKNGLAALYAVADPIEYLLKNVHQIYVQRDLMTLETAGKKDPYSEVIESLMRMDPDMIDVGEVRDQISARALANVAKSGHLALCTLHTDSIGGIVNRLSDPKLGLTRQELTSSKVLGFLSYQALLPVLCDCALSGDDAIAWHKSRHQEHEGAYIGSLLQTIQVRYGLEPERFRFKKPDGCPACRGRGTKGLTMVAEMLMPEDAWLDIVATGNDRQAMREWRSEYSDRQIDSGDMNGKVVAEHALYKALMGQIDPRNVERFGPLDQLEVIV